MGCVAHRCCLHNISATTLRWISQPSFCSLRCHSLYLHRTPGPPAVCWSKTHKHTHTHTHTQTHTRIRTDIHKQRKIEEMRERKKEIKKEREEDRMRKDKSRCCCESKEKSVKWSISGQIKCTHVECTHSHTHTNLIYLCSSSKYFILWCTLLFNSTPLFSSTSITFLAPTLSLSLPLLLPVEASFGRLRGWSCRSCTVDSIQPEEQSCRYRIFQPLTVSYGKISKPN